MHLIMGGSASGKSAFGEQAALETGAQTRYYLATMHPWGKEGKERVIRHRKQRAGKGFHTIEVYHHLENVLLRSGEKEGRVVLLECMSNLVANEQFEIGGTDKEILQRVQKGIRHLQSCAEYMIVITNEVFSDGNRYDEQTRRYLALLGQVNQDLASMADQVTEVVYGIGVPVKKY